MATFGALKRLIRARTSNRADEVRVEVILRDKITELWDAWDWSFRHASAILTTIASKTAGTVSLNATPTIIDGVGTSFVSPTDVGKKIRIGTDSYAYTVASVQGATQLTLATAYVGTSFSASTYVLYQDEYVLASNLEQLISVDRSGTTLRKVSEDANRVVTASLSPVPTASVQIRYIYRTFVPSYQDADNVPIRQDVLVYLCAADALFLIAAESAPSDAALVTLAQGYETRGIDALNKFRFAPLDALLSHI